jgi:hypothetical protein
MLHANEVKLRGEGRHEWWQVMGESGACRKGKQLGQLVLETLKKVSLTEKWEGNLFEKTVILQLTN